MEAAGWLRTLRAPNLQLAVKLTDAGRELAAPLLTAEQERVVAERRATEVRVQPLVPVRETDDADTRDDDRPVELGDILYMACRGDYVIRLDGITCLQLWRGFLTAYPVQGIFYLYVTFSYQRRLPSCRLIWRKCATMPFHSVN